MGEGKTNMFGKTYNTIGSTDSNFIIKTKGDLKVQWGNKYIDIIKNGKIASKDTSLLKLVSSKEDIKGDGIYILEGGTVCISIGDTIIDLLGTTGTTYVSFLEEQEATPELKYLALLNIGFVYDTLKEAEEASLQSGIIYVTEKNKLYVIINGKLLEYLVSFEPGLEEKKEEEPLTELIIGDLRIYNEAGYSKFNSSTRIQLLINGNPYISLELDLVKVHKSLSIDDDFFILSVDASEEKGFRIYQSNGKSTLEVDNIVWRDINKQLPTNKLTEGIIYSSYDNIVTDVVLEESTTPIGDSVPLLVYLKYKNLYKIGLFVYFYPKTLLIVRLDQILDNVTLFLEHSKTCEEDITIQITYNDTETTLLTIPAGYNSIETPLVFTIINRISIVTAPDNVITQDDLNLKNTKYEFEITDSLDNYIIISVPVELLDTIIATSFDSLIHLSRDPYIEILNNNILIVDRSKKVIVEEKEVPDETIHTNIGIIKEAEIESLTKCPKEEEDKRALKEYESSVQVGIYSDNFIGLNSKLYDSIFKKRCDYPKYDESVKIPEDFLDEKYNKAIPSIEWIKELIKLVVPSGTIAMYNGQSEIPEGWAVCDGNNGTPNLVGKFIKAVSTIDLIGDNKSELNLNNEFVITLEYLPKHNHPHKPHTHNLEGDLSGTTESSGDLTVSLNYSDYNYGIESVLKTFVTSVTGEGVTSETGTIDGVSNINTLGGNATGGNHIHSISLNAGEEVSLSSTISEELTLEDSEWPNKPIKIEPRSYSLVFIMKL